MIEKYYTDFCFVTEIDVPDGYGGFTKGYVKGVTFKAGLVTKNSELVRIGSVDRIKVDYIMSTGLENILNKGCLVMRLSDEKVFIVESNCDDMKPPSFSKLKFHEVYVNTFN